jgi:hypothetical protein
MTEPRSSSDRTPPPSRAGSFEESQPTLDPRDQERRDVVAEVAVRLRARGVHLTGHETSDEVADLLDAVERFDAAVEARGGDLFVDTPTAFHADRVTQPDNPTYVLPVRDPHASVASYVALVTQAMDRLR